MANQPTLADLQYQYYGSMLTPTTGLPIADVTVMASAARAADANSGDLTNPGFLGVRVEVDVTAVAGDDTFALVIQGKSLSGAYYTVLSSVTTLGPTGVTVLTVHPNATAANNLVASVALPTTWRVLFDYTQVTGVADTITASVVARYLR